MKKKLIIISILIIVVVLGIFFFTNNKKATTSTNVKTTTATATKGDLKVVYEDEGSADLGAKELTFGLDGTISAVNVKENDIVTQGTILMTIDDSDYQDNIKAAKLTYENAKITYEKSKNELSSTKMNLANAVKTDATNVDVAKTTYEQLLKKYQVQNGDFNTVIVDDTELRSAELAYSTAIAVPDAYSENDIKTVKITYDNAKISYENSKTSAISSLKTAKSNYESAVVTYNKAQSDYNVAITKNYDSSQAEITMQKAYLEYQKTLKTLEDAQLAAPYDCQILSVKVIVGDSVNADDKTVVLQVKKTGNAEIVASISESDIANITKGMKVEATSDSLEGKTYTGTVTNISNISTVGSGNLVTYEVNIELDGEYDEIRDAMSFSLNFILNEKADCIQIPNDAVYMKKNVQYVKVKAKDGTTTETKVTAGLTNGDYTEVTSGINEGDNVVIEETTTSTNSNKSSSSSSSKTSSKRGSVF